MLNKVKSSYFIRIVLLHLDEATKLKLVKYNKSFQKSLNINIINYKHFRGRYIVYESNEIIKEYLGYNDVLQFECEYLNNKKNGKGKEYYANGNLLFEGEYLNGKRNGKGKEYGGDGRLEFEGEYLNGKRNGKGKEYYYNGKLKFEGEYLNDNELLGNKNNLHGDLVYKLNHIKGNGIEYNYENDTLKYVGEYKNGQRSGKGKEFTFDNGLEYEGEYLNGKRNGKGKEYYSNGEIRFEGEFLNERKWTGKGYDNKKNEIYELKDGKGLIKEYDFYHFLEYEGEYLNGQRNGKGKEYYGNGELKFEGEYLNGQRYGKGKVYDDNGKISFEGEYLYDFQIKGKFYINGKLEYEGEYLFDKKWNGKGYNENGNIIYELKNGNGKVKEYFDYKYLRFDGEYLNGKRNGKGKEYKDNNLVFDGEYLNGKRIE